MMYSRGGRRREAERQQACDTPVMGVDSVRVAYSRRDRPT